MMMENVDLRVTLIIPSEPPVVYDPTTSDTRKTKSSRTCIKEQKL